MKSRLEGLNICFVAGTLGQGGAERQLYYILRALVESGSCPRLLCLTQGELWEDRIRQLGVTVDWVGQSGARLMRLMRILSEWRRHRPDVVQSQHFYTNLYVAAAARTLGIPHVGAVRSNALNEVSESPMGLLNLKLPRLIAANSRLGMVNAQSLGVPASRCFLLPNVVDTARFTPVDRSARTSVQLLGVGRLVEQKRFDRFVRVVHQIRTRTRQSFRAAIVGSGTFRKKLEDQAAAAGVNDVIEFRGDASDTVPVYQAADVLVLTSDWEGTPNVVMEAMASGLAIVATRAGGVPDLISHGETGLIFEPGDEEGITSAVQELIENPDRRHALGRAARGWIEENASCGKLPRYLESLYGRVLPESC